MRFTSLRDVSLRRNRHPSLRAGAMRCMALMRGLRELSFWLRPAHGVRFTSLRDVSLRRNRPPPLRAGAMRCMALMRGLRA